MLKSSWYSENVLKSKLVLFSTNYSRQGGTYLKLLKHVLKQSNDDIKLKNQKDDPSQQSNKAFEESFSCICSYCGMFLGYYFLNSHYMNGHQLLFMLTRESNSYNVHSSFQCQVCFAHKWMALPEQPLTLFASLGLAKGIGKHISQCRFDFMTAIYFSFIHMSQYLPTLISFKSSS